MEVVGEEVIATLAATGWESDTHGVTASSSISARTVYGPDDALGALTELRTAPDRPSVRRLLLRLALAHKPPTGFRRDIVIEHSGENRGSFDIKLGGLQPISGIARYAGLLAGATVTPTAQGPRAAASPR